MEAIETASCLNCGRPLTGPYCAGCGQKRRDTDPTLREFLHETTQELTNWDGKIPSTLTTLFFRPGRLTEDFLGGRRARWLSPLRLYLICSLAFFVSKPLAEQISRRMGREVAPINAPDGRTTLPPEVLEAIEGSMQARIFGRDRLVEAATNNAQFSREIYGVLSRAMFILLPIFALLTMLVWRRRLPRYPAHLYMALHLHSAWFGAFAVLTIVQAFFSSDVVVGGVFGIVALAYVAVYGLVAMRRVFGDSWARTLFKAVVVSVAYSICLNIVGLALLAYVLAKM